MTALPIRLAILTIAAAQSTCVADDSYSTDPPGSVFAERIEGVLSAMKETAYQHTTEIDLRNGSVKCDCSGLIGFMLRQDFPEAYLSLDGEESPWRKRPLSVTYYETFVAAGDQNNRGPWRRVVKLMDAQPGDIMAWRKKKIRQGSTTGHTCMIAGRPQLQPDGTVRVRLIDSTRGSYANDTRPTGTTGVGAGIKTFIVSKAGEPAGYFVDDRRVTARIAIGRIISLQPQLTRQKSALSPDSSFIGLNIAAAERRAKAQELDFRIIRRDGKPQPVKWKIQSVRLNFVIDNDRVVHVIRG